jgi:hypothetical protein
VDDDSVEEDIVRRAFNVTVSVSVLVTPDDDAPSSDWQWRAVRKAQVFASEAIKSDDPNLRVLFIRVYDPTYVVVTS